MSHRLEPCCDPRDSCSASSGGFHGIVQHSFALHLPANHASFFGRTNLERLAERLDADGYSVQPVGPLAQADSVCSMEHSPLAQSKLTTLEYCTPQFLVPGSRALSKPLPPAFSWAERSCSLPTDTYGEPNLIFADRLDDERHPSINDFLVRANTPRTAEQDGQQMTQLLLELLAHKRSRLFGFALANRIVTAMLPHAVLKPSPSGSGFSMSVAGPWFMQPLISFIRSGARPGQFRNIYALTLLLLPVEDQNGSLTARLMSSAEIKEIVNPGWGFASAPPLERGARFELPELLLRYLSLIAKSDVAGTGPRFRQRNDCVPQPATLRQITERVAFGVGLALAQGKGSLGERGKRRVGNDVIMSLGSARVSSVVVVDGSLKAQQVGKPVRKEPFPGALLPLMKTLAKPARRPKIHDRHARKYRLDRPFVDSDLYAVGVLPTKRCSITVSCSDAQHGIRESALMQAGSIAHMTIGAATAIGTMREIDRRLEALEGGADPTKIANIDVEIASDLAEIYDLDITRESYRAIYQRLRERLGISRDYKTLQDRMEMLYRATSTFHEDKEERMLVVLTGAIVLLSVFILIGTVVIASHGG